MVLAPSTTWLLVMMSPSSLIIHPEPALSSELGRLKKSRPVISVLMATTEGLTLATTSAMLGRAGAWVEAKGGVDCDEEVPLFTGGVAGIEVLAGGLDGTDVLVVDSTPQPALKSRDKITKGKTNSSLISVFFIF